LLLLLNVFNVINDSFLDDERWLDLAQTVEVRSENHELLLK